MAEGDCAVSGVLCFNSIADRDTALNRSKRQLSHPGKETTMNKNQLSAKTRIHSTVHDVDPGFEVILDGNTAPQKTEDKPEFTAGWHTLKLKASGNYRPYYSIEKENIYGEKYFTWAHHELLFVDVKTNEEIPLEFGMDPESERKFVQGINCRSGKDLGKKLALAGYSINKVDWKTAANYCKKFPVKMQYDKREWVDDQGDTHPGKWKLQLWEPEDSQSKKEAEWATI